MVDITNRLKQGEKMSVLAEAERDMKLVKKETHEDRANWKSYTEVYEGYSQRLDENVRVSIIHHGGLYLSHGFPSRSLESVEVL